MPKILIAFDFKQNHNQATSSAGEVILIYDRSENQEV